MLMQRLSILTLLIHSTRSSSAFQLLRNDFLRARLTSPMRSFHKTIIKMGWSETWQDILSGGNKRWKIEDAAAHEEALGHIRRTYPSDANVLCPLAGDDPMVHRLYQEGFSVTAIDLVPEALEAMRSQFKEGEWTKDVDEKSNTVIWKHSSGRATQYVGDMLMKRPELNSKFNAIYDKDSFGALQVEMRKPFVERLSEFTKTGATLYTEVKCKENHEMVKDMGPPFSLIRSDLEASYGKHFDYAETIGKVYDLSFPGAEQHAHILKRK